MKKKNKTKKIIGLIVGLVLACLSVSLLYKVYAEVTLTIELKQSIAEARAELELFNEENSTLTSYQERLNDPNFVQSIARGNHMLSKEGEKIFYLPQVNPQETNIPNDQVENTEPTPDTENN